tara:strand:+ start:1184 stop:1612 length:429 start_codon:yes stop_codon:yes gene_type:complete
MTKEELVKTLKEYSKHGTLEIPCDDDYGGKEVKETIFKTLGLDGKIIERILFDYDYYYRDMQPEAAVECKKKIINIFNKVDELKDIEFSITDCVDDGLEEMLDAANDYSYALHEGLKNGDYDSEEEWKEDLEWFLENASWLK